MKWYYVWWPWLTSNRVARVCQHQLNFLLDYLYELWHFLQISQLSIRSGAHKRFHLLLDFSQIFYRNFSKIVAPPSDESKNCLAFLQRKITSEKYGENRMKIDPKSATWWLFKLYPIRANKRLGALQTKYN